MASIYDPIDGTVLVEGLQGSDVCDQAWQAARTMAAERGSDVELEDDDGNWLVHPDGMRTAIQPEVDDSVDNAVLFDSETGDFVDCSDLGCTVEEYSEAIRESLQCVQPESHVECAGRRVYAR